MSSTWQVLLAVYFFLAGAAVSQGPRLWLIPLASITCAGSLAVLALVLTALSPSYRYGFLSRASWAHWIQATLQAAVAVLTTRILAVMCRLLKALETKPR